MWEVIEGLISDILMWEVIEGLISKCGRLLRADI